MGVSGPQETTAADATTSESLTADSRPRWWGRGPVLLAALWGFAEATLFFLVPDVLLTWLAVNLPRRGLQGCYWALGGSLVGATLMIGWASASPEAARSALLLVPGISPPLIETVRAQLVAEGLPALFLGPVQGIPYKVYVVESVALGLSPTMLLAVSVPARLLRFLLVTLLAIGLARGPLRRLSTRTLRILHVACWLAFYGVYFVVIG